MPPKDEDFRGEGSALLETLPKEVRDSELRVRLGEIEMRLASIEIALDQILRKIKES